MYLLFDIGGTKTRVGISQDGQTVTQSKIVPTPKDFEQGIQTLKQVFNELIRGQKIEAVAGGIAGPLDKEKSILVSSPHIGGWIEKPLRAELEKIFNIPVYLENDTALVALGEAISGAGVGKNIVAYIGVGTGVGGARIVNGQIDQNSLGFEPGHQIIVPLGNPCNCGGKGHLETYVGGFYLERTYQKKAEQITDTKIWDEVARYLAIGLNNTIVHWSPDIVVLGGSIMKSISLEKVTTHLKDVLKIFPEVPEVVPAKLADESGLWGALQILR